MSVKEAGRLAVVRQRYSDFGPELAREHLAEQHGFAHSTDSRTLSRSMSKVATTLLEGG